MFIPCLLSWFCTSLAIFDAISFAPLLPLVLVPVVDEDEEEEDEEEEDEEASKAALALFVLYPSAVAVTVTSIVENDFIRLAGITLLNSPPELVIPENGSLFMFPVRKAPPTGLPVIESVTVMTIV